MSRTRGSSKPLASKARLKSVADASTTVDKHLPWTTTSPLPSLGLAHHHTPPVVPSTVWTTVDAELTRSSSQLRLLARHTQQKPNKQKPHVASTGHSAMIQLPPLSVHSRVLPVDPPPPVVHSRIPNNNKNNNNNQNSVDESVLKGIWQTATAVAKQQQQQQQQHDHHTKTRCCSSNQTPEDEIQEEEEQGDDAVYGGTTRARFRRLVGTLARKTLVQIHRDACGRVARKRLWEACAVPIHRVVRRFLGRRRRWRVLQDRERHVAAAAAAAEAIQCAWRQALARKEAAGRRRQRKEEKIARDASLRRKRMHHAMSVIQRFLGGVIAASRANKMREKKKKQQQCTSETAAKVVVGALRKWRDRQRQRQQRANAYQDVRRKPQPWRRDETWTIHSGGGDAIEKVVVKETRRSGQEDRSDERARFDGDCGGGGDHWVVEERPPSSRNDELVAPFCISIGQEGGNTNDALAAVFGVASASPRVGTIDVLHHCHQEVPRQPTEWPWSTATITTGPETTYSGSVDAVDVVMDATEAPRTETTTSGCPVDMPPALPLDTMTHRAVQPVGHCVSIPSPTTRSAAALLPQHKEDEEEDAVVAHLRSLSLTTNDHHTADPHVSYSPIVEAAASVSISNFLSTHFVRAIRTQLVHRHRAALCIQRVVRLFLAHRAVHVRRRLQVALLTRELDASWQIECEALCMWPASPVGNDPKTAHQEDNEEGEEDNEEDGRLLPPLGGSASGCVAASGSLWTDVLPMRTATTSGPTLLPPLRGLHESHSHSAASSSAPQVGLWKWSWTTNRWQWTAL